MKRTFRPTLAPLPGDDADLLAERRIDAILEALPTRRAWVVEDLAEADEVGWVAASVEGLTRYTLTLTTSARERAGWTLIADASTRGRDRAGAALQTAIMLGCGAGTGAAALLIQGGLDQPRHLARRIAVAVLAAAFGIFPIGLGLAIAILRPRAKRRGAQPIPGGRAFLDEVERAVRSQGDSG